jgi:hypothetical protein
VAGGSGAAGGVAGGAVGAWAFAAGNVLMPIPIQTGKKRTNQIKERRPYRIVINLLCCVRKYQSINGAGG